jgi:biopolymer transport protein TolR
VAGRARKGLVHKKPARLDGPRSEINVTPLVDVCLVLLIIFMVIVPQMAAGANVNVPGARNFDKVESKDEPLTLSVTQSGSYYLEKSALAPERIIAELKRFRKLDPHRRIRIKADKSVPYGYVRAAYKACQEVGFPGAGLQVGDKKKQKGS